MVFSNPRAVHETSRISGFKVVLIGVVAALGVVVVGLLVKATLQHGERGAVPLMAVGEIAGQGGGSDVTIDFDGPPTVGVIGLPPLVDLGAEGVHGVSEPSVEQLEFVRDGVPATAAALERDDLRSYTGEPLRRAYVLRMTVTAYSPDARSCGRFADGQTASGKNVTTNGMHLVAADTDLLPFGTHLSIPGYASDRPVPVLDRGGAIRGYRLDLLMPTHREAVTWGVRELEVVVYAVAAEEEPRTQ